MMRSMYAAISGLRNHQIRMDVIGNNIANVNTAGYKKSRVVFKDTLYQNIRGASQATSARGGTNPMGVGLGMTLSSIDQIHTPMGATTTNKTTDMAIDGNGYFLLECGGEQYYSRAGAFDFDTQGNLEAANGYLVQGWVADRTQWDQPDYKIKTTATPGKIDISPYKNLNPVATTSMIFSGNLSSKNTTINTTDSAAATYLDPAGLFGDPPTASSAIDAVPVDTANGEFDNKVITSEDVYDSLGNKYRVYFKFFKTNTNSEGDVGNTWHCDVSLDPNFGADNPTSIGIFGTDDFTGKDVLRIADLLTFKKDGTVDTSLTPTIVIPGAANGANDIACKIDLSQLTQYSPQADVLVDQDGYTAGSMSSYSVGIDGTITGTYNNGQSRALARVAVANFQNPAGLKQAGSTLFQYSNNSGDPQIGAPGDLGMGAIIPGSLEMSNVDISEEFTDMIVTQRGFQANSRIITTSDEMLQELVNLKR